MGVSRYGEPPAGTSRIVGAGGAVVASPRWPIGRLNGFALDHFNQQTSRFVGKKPPAQFGDYLSSVSEDQGGMEETHYGQGMHEAAPLHRPPSGYTALGYAGLTSQEFVPLRREDIDNLTRLDHRDCVLHTSGHDVAVPGAELGVHVSPGNARSVRPARS